MQNTLILPLGKCTVLFNTAIVFKHIKPPWRNAQPPIPTAQPTTWPTTNTRKPSPVIAFQTVAFNRAAELSFIPQQVQLNRTSLAQPWDQLSVCQFSWCVCQTHGGCACCGDIVERFLMAHWLLCAAWVSDPWRTCNHQWLESFLCN